ncbi:AAA+-type ATPase [Cryptotrichosporon argae]
MSLLGPVGLRAASAAVRPPSLMRLASTRARTPAAKAGFFLPSYRPNPSARLAFFTPSRLLSTSRARLDTASSISASTLLPSGSPSAHAAAFASGPAASATATARTIPRSLPTWLLGCSALVFGIVVIGGLTRLTESGLSITEWQPITGIRPPITEAEWDVEWEKYRVSPEGIMMNANIDRSEFKKIFYMEWAHRVAGRTLGVAFVVPMIYYMARYRLPRGLPLRLVALGLGIGFQGALGWYMVQSGLDQEIVSTNAVPRVSQYRLAAHLSAALALYVGMVHTALGLRRDVKLSAAATTAEGRAAVAQLVDALNAPAARRFKALVALAGAMVFATAVSGAFVAGLDAGLVYNEFPTMGGRLHPPADELMDARYAKRSDGSDKWWRNMLENPVTAQFDHRVLAMTTFTVLVAQHLVARRPVLRLGARALPRAAQRWSAWVAAAALGQVSLGITTLLYLVPIPLAAAHQAGSVVLLTTLMGLAASLRRPRQAMAALRTAAAQAGAFKTRL